MTALAAGGLKAATSPHRPSRGGAATKDLAPAIVDIVIQRQSSGVSGLVTRSVLRLRPWHSNSERGAVPDGVSGAPRWSVTIGVIQVSPCLR